MKSRKSQQARRAAAPGWWEQLRSMPVAVLFLAAAVRPTPSITALVRGRSGCRPCSDDQATAGARGAAHPAAGGEARADSTEARTAERKARAGCTQAAQASQDRAGCRPQAAPNGNRARAGPSDRCAGRAGSGGDAEHRH